MGLGRSAHSLEIYMPKAAPSGQLSVQQNKARGTTRQDCYGGETPDGVGNIAIFAITEVKLEVLCGTSSLKDLTNP